MAASSPLASWSDHGMPASPQYSSVRRGSNMRRKLTLPVEPPVATMTALRARMLSLAPVVVDRDAEHRAGIRAPARWSAVMRCSSRISTPAFLAAASSDRIKPLPEDRVFCIAGSAGSPVCTIGQCITAQCISRGTEFPTELPPMASGRLVDKDDAVGEQPFKGRSAVVRKRANDFVSTQIEMSVISPI